MLDMAQNLFISNVKHNNMSIYIVKWAEIFSTNFYSCLVQIHVVETLIPKNFWLCFHQKHSKTATSSASTKL